ncbi:hypothetical protein PTKIN_Ptkin09bG0255200 [Pterospermum kingtungense]
MLLSMLMLMFTAQLEPVSADAWPWEKRYVIIRNDLGSRRAMTIHCKSKDDDLGRHRLGFGREYQFSFRYIPFITTFTCNVGWKRSYDRKWVSHSFDAYSGPSTYYSRCYWTIQETRGHNDAFHEPYISVDYNTDTYKKTVGRN